MRFGKIVLPALDGNKPLRLNSSTKQVETFNYTNLLRQRETPVTLNVLSMGAFVYLPFDKDWSVETWTKDTVLFTFPVPGIYRVHLDVSGETSPTSGEDTIQLQLVHSIYYPPPDPSVNAIMAEAEVSGISFHLSADVLVQVASNDQFYAAMANMTNTNDITVNYANMVVEQLRIS